MASLPKIILHFEGLAFATISLLIFNYIQGNWMLYFLVLAPDLGMLGYLINNKIGSFTYNLLHTYIFPLLLFLFGFFYNSSLTMQISLIWITHIGADRALGYGLKYKTRFKDTHLNRV